MIDNRAPEVVIAEELLPHREGALSFVEMIRAVRLSKVEVDPLFTGKCCVHGTSRGPCAEAAQFRAELSIEPIKLHFCDKHAARHVHVRLRRRDGARATKLFRESFGV